MCRISASCSMGIETPNSASISDATLIWANYSHACRSPVPVSRVSFDLGTRNAAATIEISFSSIVPYPVLAHVVSSSEARLLCKGHQCLPLRASSSEKLPSVPHPVA